MVNSAVLRPGNRIERPMRLASPGLILMASVASV